MLLTLKGFAAVNGHLYHLGQGNLPRIGCECSRDGVLANGYGRQFSGGQAAAQVGVAAPKLKLLSGAGAGPLVGLFDSVPDHVFQAV